MIRSDQQTGKVIDVSPLGSAIAVSKHQSLLETDRLKIKRMVLRKEEGLPEHKAPGEITVHCLEGRLAFTCSGETVELCPFQFIHLGAGELHAVKAIEDSSFLLSIYLHH